MDQTQNRKNGWKIVLGVFLFLVVFIGLLFGIEYLFTKRDIKKENTTITSPWKKSVEKRFQKNNAEHKIINARLDKHADAISDLQLQIDGIKNGKTELSKTENLEAKKEQPKKVNKYQKGWDYKDFPENW